jgi:hypothetical protein
VRCHNEHGPCSVSETQTNSLGFSDFGSVNQKSTQRKRGFLNYPYRRNLEVADKGKAKRIVVKNLSCCVREGQNFADNTVVRLGCSEGVEICKVLNEKIKLQANNRCEGFPLTCNSHTVSGLCILLSVTLMFHIFIHISLFIFL